MIHRTNDHLFKQHKLGGRSNGDIVCSLVHCSEHWYFQILCK